MMSSVQKTAHEGMVFAGRVEFDLKATKITALRPVLLWSQESRCWEQIKGDRSSELFPDRGRVFWWGAPDRATKGTYWEFRSSESPSYDGVTKLDRFRVSEPTVELVEMIDLRQFGDEHRIRTMLTGGSGINLGCSPIGRVMLQVDSNRWIGPVRLTPHSQAAHWMLDINEPIHALPCVREMPRTTEVLLEGRSRRLLPIERECNKASTVRNWQSDSDILRNALKRVRKLDQEFSRNIEISRRTTDAFVTAVTSFVIPSGDLLHEHAKLERLREFTHNLEIEKEFVQEATSILLSSGSITAGLDQAREEIIQRTKLEAKNLAENELQDLRTKADLLRQQIASSESALRKIERSIAERRKFLSSEVDQLGDELEQRLSEIAARPHAFIADLAAARPVLFSALQFGPARPGLSPNTSSSETPTVSFPFLGLRGSRRDIADTADVESIRGALIYIAQQKGLQVSALLELLTSALANVVPVTVRDGGLQAVTAFAHCLFAERAVMFPLSPLCSSLEDIYFHTQGAKFASEGRSLSHLSAWAVANPDKLCLAVLDGINRAPVEYSAAPLFSAYCNGGSVSSPLPLLHGVAMPPNLILVATADEGTHRFALSRDLILNARLLDVDVARPAAVLQQHGSVVLNEPAFPALSVSTWEKLRQQVAANLQLPDARIDALESKFPELIAGRAIIARLVAARKVLGLRPEEAVAEYCCCILPGIVKDLDRIEDVLGHLRSTFPQYVSVSSETVKYFRSTHNAR